MEFVFLHSVRSVTQVAWSGMFRVRNIDALFFMLEWA
jgi:hypothetical protein